MQLDNFSNLLIAGAILILAALVYLAFYLKNTAAEIGLIAYKLDVIVMQRLDMLPLWVEYLGKFVDKTSLKGLIQVRTLAMEAKVGAGNKGELENSLWAEYGRLHAAVADIAGAQKDLQLAAIEKNIKEIGVNVEQAAIKYNFKVGKFNGWVGNLIFKPVSMVMKLNKLEKF